MSQAVCRKEEHRKLKDMASLARSKLDFVTVPGTAFPSPFVYVLPKKMLWQWQSRNCPLAQLTTYFYYDYYFYFILIRFGPDVIGPVRTLRCFPSWLVWCGQGKEEQLGEVCFYSRMRIQTTGSTACRVHWVRERLKLERPAYFYQHVFVVVGCLLPALLCIPGATFPIRCCPQA